LSLTLTIVNVEALENGESTRLTLDRHGAVIGRSAQADWSLPDPRNYISSVHCEIDYRDGAYLLADKSTNGTFLNGQTTRMDGLHILAEGDEISIGHYQIRATLADVPASAAPEVAAPPPQAAPAPAWSDPPPASPASAWGDPALPPSSAPPASAWSPAPAPPAASPTSGWATPAPAAPGSSASAWTDPPGTPPATPAGGWATPATPAPSPLPAAPSTWSDPPAAAATGDAWGALPPAQASGWAREPAGAWGPPEAAPNQWNQPGAAISGRGPMAQAWTAPQVAASPAVDVWARVAGSHGVDWGRGGFAGAGGTPPAPSAPAPEAAAPGAAASAPPDTGAWNALLSAAGVNPAQLTAGSVASASAAGALLRRLVAGLVVMLEARARAKAELHATGTRLEFDGNNPLKFARTPEQALARLMNPPERGFMPLEVAVEDAYKDLQAHQIATLSAMQSALRVTLDRFSPTAIRSRFKPGGLFSGSRKAQLWAAYEREFEGVAQGSDEAFMDVFAKQFREAYERAAAEMKSR